MVWAALAKRLASGLFVLNAGTEHFSYFVGEEIGLVARLARFDRALAPGYGHYDNVALRMEIHDGRTGAKLHGKIWFRGLRPFVIERFEDRTGLRDLKPGLYTVTAELVDRNTVVDRITHEFSVVEDPADTPDSEIVRVRDGEFVIDGRRWRERQSGAPPPHQPQGRRGDRGRSPEERRGQGGSGVAAGL